MAVVPLLLRIRQANLHYDNETVTGEGGKFVTFPPRSGRKFGQLFLPTTLHDQHIYHNLRCSNTPGITRGVTIIMCFLVFRYAVQESVSRRSTVPTTSATTRRERKTDNGPGLGCGVRRRPKLNEPSSTTDASQHPA